MIKIVNGGLAMLWLSFKLVAVIYDQDVLTCLDIP
jgi:hypothetical protein